MKRRYCETYVAPDGFTAEIWQRTSLWDDKIYYAADRFTKEPLFGGMLFPDVDSVKKALDQ